MGTTALRLVRSSTRCSHNYGLELVGRSLRPYLHSHATAKRHDRRGRHNCARGQELQGASARRLSWDRRQGGFGEGVCKVPESHRSEELRRTGRQKLRLATVNVTNSLLRAKRNSYQYSAV